MALPTDDPRDEGGGGGSNVQPRPKDKSNFGWVVIGLVVVIALIVLLTGR